MQTTYNDIRKAVIRSQHCQRNWNLDKQIPEEDIDLLITGDLNEIKKT